MDIINILILLGTGLFAGFLNVMAGGGSTLTLPVLIFMGLDSTTANGTNRIAILIQNISAIASFKSEKYSEFAVSSKLALFTLPGGIIGSITALKIGDEFFEIILGIVMIGVVISMLLPKKNIKQPVEKTGKIPWAGYLTMFGIGFYGGFIQVGVGFLLMAALQLALRQTLVHVNMHKVFIVLVYTIPALIVFMVSGNINYVLGIALAAGNATGGWIAAKMQVKKGEGIIKYVLVLVIIFMALKLFGLF